MTLLPIYHRRLAVPEFRPVVFGPSLVNEDATVHRVWGCGGPFLVHTAEALRYGAKFCRRCWPGGRCGICGFPSGNSDTCGPCGRAQHDLERRLDDAA